MTYHLLFAISMGFLKIINSKYRHHNKNELIPISLYHNAVGHGGSKGIRNSDY